MQIRYFGSEGMKTAEIDPLQIKEFGLINYAARTRTGTFKAWLKSAYIYMKDSTAYNKILSGSSCIDEIVEALKSANIAFTKNKAIREEYKNYNLRRAVDWIYKVKTEEVCA